MRRPSSLLLAGMAVLSCTAYIDPPRPSGRMGGIEIEILSRFHMQALLPASSLAADRSGNACYTDQSGWTAVSVGWDGAELFRINMANPRWSLVDGGVDCFWLINDLNKKIACYDRKGQQLSETAYSGFSASAGAAATNGDIFLLDGNNARIKVIDRAGNEQRSFQIEIPAGGVFRPSSISVDDTRNVLALSDGRNGVIAFYSIYGAKQDNINAASGDNPQAICFDYLGRLWVCQPAQGKVAVYVFDGSRWEQRAEIAMQKPYAVALSPFGSGVIAEEGSLAFVKF